MSGHHQATVDQRDDLTECPSRSQIMLRYECGHGCAAAIVLPRDRRELLPRVHAQWAARPRIPNPHSRRGLLALERG
jgi:hypothetical protein